MILPNGLMLDFLERCCAEKKCVVNFDHTEKRFLEIHGVTKAEYSAMIRGLEKQIANCRQDLRGNVYDKINEIAQANKAEEQRIKDQHKINNSEYSKKHK